jgi:hypothetical protein
MGHKPFVGVAGTVLVSLALSGCEYSRPYYGDNRNFMPGQQMAGMPQAATYYQPQILPARAMSTGTVMAPMPGGAGGDRAAGSMDVTPNVQLAGGPSTATAGGPMLTITMPAVKFTVPISSAYCTTPAGTAVATMSSPEGPATTAAVSAPAAAPAEMPAVRSAVQVPAQAIQYAPPVLPYNHPAPQPTVQPPQPAPAAPPAPQVSYSPQPTSGVAPAHYTAPAPVAMGPSLGDEPVSDSRAMLATPPAMSPPPPAWPRMQTPAEEATAPEIQAAPLPVRRSPVLYSSPPQQPNQQSPYYQ